MTQELPYELNPPEQYTSFGWEEDGVKSSLTTEQITKLNNWLIDVNSRAAEKQYLERRFIETGRPIRLPLQGCTGGGLTFSISGSSIGYVVKVTASVTGETIDLSDYEYW